MRDARVAGRGEGALGARAPLLGPARGAGLPLVRPPLGGDATVVASGTWGRLFRLEGEGVVRAR